MLPSDIRFKSIDINFNYLAPRLANKGALPETNTGALAEMFMRTFLFVAALAVSSPALAAQPGQQHASGRADAHQSANQGNTPRKAAAKRVSKKPSRADQCRKKFGRSYNARTDQYVVRGAKRRCRL